MVAPNQSGAILCAPETEIPPRNFGGNHPRDLHGKHGKVNNAPVQEIQPEASFAALSGLDFDTVQVFDHVDWIVRSSLFDPYANHAVANIMRKMDYFPRMGSVFSDYGWQANAKVRKVWAVSTLLVLNTGNSPPLAQHLNRGTDSGEVQSDCLRRTNDGSGCHLPLERSRECTELLN